MERAEREATALAQHQEISKRAAGVARALFARQRKVVLAKLAGQKARKGTRHWLTPNGRPPVVTKVISADDVFDTERWDDEWTTDMGAVYDDVYTQVSPEVARALEDNDYDPSAPAVAAAIATLVKLHSTASARANATTAAQIQAAIAQVEQTGASMDALSAAVGGVFDTAGTSRADTVGDYVATGALGGAAVLGAAWAAGVASGSPPDEAITGVDDSGAPVGPGGAPVAPSGITKLWQTQQDELVRIAHAEADGQTVPIDQPFNIGGEDLMYPGDPSGSPELVINCRCYLIFQAAGEEVGTADTGESPEEAGVEAPTTVQAGLRPYRMDRKLGVVLKDKAADRDYGFHALPDAICLACRSKVTPTAAGACPRCGSTQLHALEGPNGEDQSPTPATTHVPDIKTLPSVTVAGLVVRAEDTGRILMIQRAQDDPDDPAAGKWEWPGGHLEPGEVPLAAAKREWQEETGCELPRGRVAGNWVSGDGIYEGFIWIISHQDDLDINEDHEAREWGNPDDPDGDRIEVAAWWDPEDLPGMPALRSECRLAPWPLITGPMEQSKGDVAGHAFHGNQHTGGIGGGGDARTGLPRTSFVDPATGQPMTRTQIGGVGEQLFLRAAGPDLADKLGGPLQHISEGANRRAPLDFMADHLTGVEVKTLSSEAQNQKTAISAEEKERKYAEAERLGLKQTATVLQVLDLQAGTMKVAYSDGIVSKSFATMTPLGTYDVSQHLTDLGFKRVDQLDLEEKIRYQTWLAKGDASGHAFHGNQWTGGIGGAGSDRAAARQMTDRSKEIEPAITAQMTETVGKANGGLIGTDFAVKTEDSLTRKISSDALAQGITHEEATAKISDSLRYTMSFDGSRYSEGARAAVADLQERGYSLEKLKNTWSPVDSPYRGVNSQWTTPAGDKFELQFHTPESFDMKENVNHKDYEESRLPTTSDERAAELRQAMGDRSATLVMPTGALALSPESFGLLAPPGE